jgi:nitroimidazol reductase NimA-like FMN-containing flavoprotein (pyridoxamine 5'-phosphate oxidase superfamily)
MTADERAADLIATLEPIPPATCWNLLATATVGRVGLIVDGKPEVLPVNYAIDGESILFRTGESTVLTQASLSIIAFEVDHFDPGDESGWSVMLQGMARDVGDAIDATSERQRHLSLVTWAPGDRTRWFHLKPGRVTGRRVAVMPAAL